MFTTEELTGGVTELVTTPAGNLTDSGTIAFTDVDLTDVHGVSAAGSYTGSGTALGALTATVTADTTGTGAGGVVTWTYTVPASATEYLGYGESKLETFTVNFTDNNGFTVTKTISVTITGTNDAPVFTTEELTGGVTELVTTPAGNLTDSGTIAYTDVDLTDVHGVSAAGSYSGSGTALGALTATVTADTTGSGLGGEVTWTYTVPASATEYLGYGESKLETFTVNFTDNNGFTVTKTISVTITGTNDAPVVTSAAQAGSVTEAVNNSADELNNVTHEATGALAFGDVDLADIHSVSVDGNATAGYRGTLSATIADASTGDGAGSIGWTFAVADGALDDLAAIDVLTQTYTVTVDDGHGGTSSQTVTITINGAADNQAPVVTGAVTLAPTAEDSGARLITQAELLTNSSDPDGPSLTATGLAITAGNGTLVDNGNGTWSYTPALNDDTDVSFSFAVTDGVAAPVATSATLDVTPVNDAPVISTNGGGATASVSIAENFAAVTTVTSTDVDGDTPSYSVLTGPGSPDAAKFTIDESTGALGFITAPDFETPGSAANSNVYTVQVQASDGSGGTDVQTITVNVTDVAAEYVVTSTADSTAVGTLRSAISYANAHAGTVITFSNAIANSTITLTSELPLVTGNGTMIDGGSNHITVSGNDLYRGFYVGDATNNISATIENLTIAHAMAKGGDGANGGGGSAGLGGALFVSSHASLTISNRRLPFPACWSPTSTPPKC